MIGEGAPAAECMKASLTNVQVVTWLSRESWDIVFLESRSLFLRRSKGVAQTIAAGAVWGPLLGGISIDVFSKHAVESQKELTPDEIEAMRKGCTDVYEFLHPDFPSCRLKNPFWGSSIIELGEKEWRFRFTKRQLTAFREWSQRITKKGASTQA